MSRLTPVVKVLLILNVAIFALQYLLESYRINLTEHFALYYFGSSYFAPYQLITHMFLHGGLWHILGNMYALFIFGPPLEDYFDSKRFLALYIIAGLGAAVLHMGVSAWEIQQTQNKVEEYKLHASPAEFTAFMNTEGAFFVKKDDNITLNQYLNNPTSKELELKTISRVEEIATRKQNIPTVGASGAVFGILAAFGIVFANIKLVLLFPPIPIKAKYLVFGYALYEIYAIYQANPTDNVAHFAHIGGFIFGIILVKLWGKSDKPMRWN